MSLTNTYTFEEGTDGAAVTTASGATSLSGSPTYAAAGALHGGMGVLIEGVTGDRLNFPITSAGQVSIYTKLCTSGPVTNLVYGLLSGGLAYMCRIRLNAATGLIEIQDPTQTVQATSTASYPPYQWFRSDIRYDGSSGISLTVTMLIFNSSNAEGIIPDDTIGPVTFAITAVPARMGLVNASGGWSTYYDTLRTYDDTTDWPLPYASATTAWLGA